ncbi:chromate efflux transporter [Candidatus Phycosocius spiralis]|uniref:Chromate transporter n=1 Tax=Candidatus Phycosocius spiralis TaxID=2815099 RepID=A0ABQ4PV50_9PROT|nr:chromate efflux transporter [Candidatus Phycosocius spiralis]GIU66588.1 chromate transporter [Candidatus Phycosocius spiralis]
MSENPSLHDFIRESLWIGMLGFGGPAGQIALMHRRFVETRKWVSEETYMHALSYCMLLPGPEAQQLATYIGWRLYGVRGGLIGGLLFIVPGAALMLGLSLIYVHSTQLALFQPVLQAIRAAVLVLVCVAVYRLAHKAIKDYAGWIISAAAFSALFFFQIPFPWVILVALLIGWFRAPSLPTPGVVASAGRLRGRAWQDGAIWLSVWLVPLMGVAMAQMALLTQIGLAFSGLSMVTFGGAYASTVWLNQYGVETAGWLTSQNMIDGLGLVQTIPGPLVLINQFVGFMAGWREGGIGLAFAAAFMASWCTFAPSFLWIFVGAPYAEQLRSHAKVGGALSGVSAGVVGVMANLALWFGEQTLFTSQIKYKTFADTTFTLPDWATINPIMLVLVPLAIWCLQVAKLGPALTLMVTVLTSIALAVVHWR